MATGNNSTYNKGSQSNTRSKTTASRSTSTARSPQKARSSQSSRQASASRTGGRKTKAQLAQEQARKNEIHLFICLAVCTFFFISNFGWCGVVGNFFAKFMFGLFGVVEYVLPLYIFLTEAFLLSNGAKKTVVNRVLCVGLFIVAAAFIFQLTAGADHMTAKLLYDQGAQEKKGGGFILGGLLVVLYNLIGKPGAIIVIALLIIIGIIVVMNVSLIDFAKERSAQFKNRYNALYEDDDEEEIDPEAALEAKRRTKLDNIKVEQEKPAVPVKKKKKKVYEGQKIRDFSDLKIGDYVVHENHGLGIYKGIEKVEVDKVVKDYIKIEYRDGGNLYILATGLDVIQKYASADAAKRPKLNKLGTQEWTKTKSKVKSAVNEVAKDLVELYAVRQEKQGFAFGHDTVWQQEFEEMFPFEETQDQLLAIEATKADMESSRIMDRLICGDVGYGKTEIAIRAAFKAVQDGKQVAFLVPTTILAQQHYNTFVQRMKDFPVRIDMLSRFRTAGEQKKTLEDLKKGLVDIVIGTHRLLSADVKYKDLGLLIIDEEQRFGVRHKEKIKQVKDTVDVLTLTATPIPRTLHMSLVGIRDMSVLEEAPNERQPIQTYVMEYNEEMVREAIVRELSRQGQVYYVYNRINNIAEITDRIQALVPEATVAYAHGQMKEHELEKIMYGFINGEIDVLVSTTIIETGLDISNVNTMIIHDSDNMGLSQLYQLRGRVGRSNRTSYAFLMYKRDKMLKEVAEKRLQAIKEFTDLGSGFKIAMRDLEIRGAGNLLGERQHGHMEAVGYDLYCKMLNEAVKTLKGTKKLAEDFNTYVDMDVDAFIPPSYIVNEAQKLDIYKRIASLENEAECEDMKAELLDRFGNVPKSVDNLIRISLIRVQAHERYVTEIKGKIGCITFYMEPYAPVHVEKLPQLLDKYKNTLQFSAKGTPNFVLKYKKYGLVEKEADLMISLTQRILKEMAILYTE